MRDINPKLGRSLQNHAARRNLNFLTINFNFNHLSLPL
jgi:hypothetical protein